MPTRPIDRLLFAQGGLCFFCGAPLPTAEASVEHLVATANGGSNHDENCVACCKALNALLGRMSLKEKLRVVLNQKGSFSCPNGRCPTNPPLPTKKPDGERVALVIADLHKRGSARPRSLQTLSGTISALFRKTLSDQEVAKLVDTLKARGIVSIDGTQVAYKLPPIGTS